MSLARNGLRLSNGGVLRTRGTGSHEEGTLSAIRRDAKRPGQIGRRSPSPWCSRGRLGMSPGPWAHPMTSSGSSATSGAIDDRVGVTEIGPELLVVPFWTRRVLRGDRARRRPGRLRGRIRTIPCPATRCRSPRSARRCSPSVQDDLGRRIWPQLQDAMAADRLPRACAMRSSSATPPASRRSCASTTTSPRCRAASSSTATSRAPSCSSPARASTTRRCRSARCSPGRRW